MQKLLELVWAVWLCRANAGLGRFSFSSAIQSSESVWVLQLCRLLVWALQLMPCKASEATWAGVGAAALPFNCCRRFSSVMQSYLNRCGRWSSAVQMLAWRFNSRCQQTDSDKSRLSAHMSFLISEAAPDQQGLPIKGMSRAGTTQRHLCRTRCAIPTTPTQTSEH